MICLAFLLDDSRSFTIKIRIVLNRNIKLTWKKQFNNTNQLLMISIHSTPVYHIGYRYPMPSKIKYVQYRLSCDARKLLPKMSKLGYCDLVDIYVTCILHCWTIALSWTTRKFGLKYFYIGKYFDYCKMSYLQCTGLLGYSLVDICVLVRYKWILRKLKYWKIKLSHGCI